MRGRLTLIFQERIRKPLSIGDNYKVKKTTDINILLMDLR